MRRRKDIFWGLVLIITALVTIGMALNLIQGSMIKILWVALFASTALVNLFSLSWGGVFFPIAIIAHIYKPELHLTSIWPIYTAALLLTFGFSLITKNVKRKRRKNIFFTVNGKEFTGDAKEFKDNIKGQFSSRYESTADGEFIEIENNFNDASRYINSDNLKYVSIENNFGNLRVYFDNTRYASSGSTVKVENNFGKTTLYIPSNVNIYNNLSSTLGSVSSEENRTFSADDPTLTIEGEANFGSIEIVLI